MDEFIGLGQVEKRDSKAHPTDPRSVVRSHSNGITLRAHFAGLVTQGLCAEAGKMSIETIDCGSIAVWAVKIADALIIELNKEIK